jgi:N-terminal domain of anti-restriction factor ArdC
MAPSFEELLRSAVEEPGTISRAYSAFHNYSLGNQLLALGQCIQREITPGPIATFMGWKDKGRFVRKGERAITLCQPVTVKRQRDEQPDAEKSADVFTRFVYRPHWFVLAQTEGNELPAPTLPTWDRARALAALDVSEVPFDLLDGNCQGLARQRSIAVSPVAALPWKTCFHEVAHVLLGHTSEGEQADSDITPRSLREVEAECVAMLCCAALDLPGVAEARGYVQHWGGAGNPIPERSAQRILKAADQILKAGREDEGGVA